MFKLKLPLMIAGIACILSFLIGIISGGSFLIVLIRAAICGVVFFALVAGIYMLINMFLPELIQPEEHEENLGSHVDISVEDAKTEAGQASVSITADKSESQTNVEEQIPKNNEGSPKDDVPALDQNSKNEYTKEERVKEAASDSNPAPVSPETPDPQAVSQTVEPPAEMSEESKFWKDIFPQFGADDTKEVKREYAASEKTEDTSKVQTKTKETDPKKMDRRQMASTIQLMLKQ